MRISDWSSDVCSSDLLVDHHLRAICEIAELGLPQHQRFRQRQRIAIFKAENAEFRQGAVQHLELAAADLGQRDIFGLGLLIHPRSEEHTSELQSLMRISYPVSRLKNKNNQHSTSKP